MLVSRSTSSCPSRRGEADYARGLVVTGNTFEYVGYGMQSYGGVALGAVDPDGTLALPGGHVNISIVNNTWRNSEQAG